MALCTYVRVVLICNTLTEVQKFSEDRTYMECKVSCPTSMRGFERKAYENVNCLGYNHLVADHARNQSQSQKAKSTSKANPGIL